MALFERSVGYYSTMINVNAYHQPGVEAGKKAAKEIIALQAKIVEFLCNNRGTAHSVSEIADGIKASENQESVFLICQHLSANDYRRIKKFGSLALTEITFQSQ